VLTAIVFSFLHHQRDKITHPLSKSRKPEKVLRRTLATAWRPAAVPAQSQEKPAISSLFAIPRNAMTIL
jgi:hypothetical protein